MKIDASSRQDHRPQVRADALRLAVVAARFNSSIVDELVAGALECLGEHGIASGRVEVVRVPGAWELPLAAQWVAASGEVDGIIALGCVIRGDTPHFDFVARGATDGLQRVSLDFDIPIGFGLLTTDDAPQARARAGGSEGNKGGDAALAVLEMIAAAQSREPDGVGGDL